MRHYKPILVTFTAIILVCSIPISACAIGIGDADMQTYKPIDKVSGRLLGEFPAVGVWYHFRGSDYESVGIYDSGMPKYAFIIWVPLQGYYLVSVQETDMKYQLRGTVNPPSGGSFYLYGTLYIQKNTNGLYDNSYYNWRGDGGYANEYDSMTHFQTAFLSYYIVFHRIYTKSSNGSPQRSSQEDYTVPHFEEPPQNIKDKIQQTLPGGSATFEVLDGKSSETPTYPDGTPVPTNQAGNPVPTNEFGQTMPTLPNGKPVPTYPDGSPAEYYTDASGVYHTVPYTIYDNSNNESDVNDHFSRFNDMISDLDNLSSIMESNAEELSGHVNGTRGLVDDVLSWFPAPVIAILVCGVIMIIAVKITGSGKS